MNLSIISLIVLVIVVAIGFIKKVNLGFLSIKKFPNLLFVNF